MTNILDYIEKYKFAILGTVLFHILVFAYTNFATVKRPYKIPEPEVEMELPLEDVIVDPEMMKLLEMNKDQPNISEEVYNVSSDANDDREKSFEEFSTQALDEDVNKTVEELEQEYKEYWASQHEGEGSDANSSADIDAEEKDNKVNQNKQGTNIQNNGDKAFAGPVMVEYDLKNRKAFSLPSPGYTCNGSGTVVINIRVDKAGEVKSASYNEAASSRATECMINKALAYAKKSRFNLASGSQFQDGYITYIFQGQ